MWYDYVFLLISRCTAYFGYPLMIILFLTKTNHLRTLLQRSWLSMFIPFYDLHHLHVIAGTVMGGISLVHGFFHLLRWGLQGRIFLLWSSYTGISGLIAFSVTPFIVFPMQ